MIASRWLAGAYVGACELCRTAEEFEFAVRAKVPDATADELAQLFDVYNELMDVQVRLALRDAPLKGRAN